MKWLLIPLLLVSATVANAELPPLSRNLVSGNALINPESVQKIVKALIVQGLQKNYAATSHHQGVTLVTDATEHMVRIPEKPLLKEILTTLGVTSNQVQVLLDPVETTINFGPESFQILIENAGTNLFNVRVLWSVEEIFAESKSLKVVVPKGVFDRAFTIASSPIKIGIKPGTGAVKAILELTANLTSEGSRISLTKFKTNLEESKNRLQLKLGRLTVDGKPLELEIQSNGQSIKTDEPTIRAQFQNFEPAIMKNLQSQLAGILQQKFTEVSVMLDKHDPFKAHFDSDEILAKNPISKPELARLFKDISADFVFSYVQQIPEQRFFTTQISSQICLGKECLTNAFGTSNITTKDTANMIGNDTGVILYESWIQNVVNSLPFQKRIFEYYYTTLKSPGVGLGADGIKIHFSPAKNAVIAVLNLKIDIKATTDPNAALQSWSNFWKYTKNQLADMWENMAGSGQYVYVPVEITAKIAGIGKTKEGKKALIITTDIPFFSNGTISNTYKYRSNIGDMNATIRKELLKSVKAEVGKNLPKKIELPLDAIEMEGIKFNINQVMITPNKGLLVSGCVQ